MSIDLDALSRKELVALNHRIVEWLKMLDTLDTHHSMLQFHPGARVSFAAQGDERLTGTLLKFNQKTVTVVTYDGRRWNISPQLLAPIKDVSRGDIIEGTSTTD
ncbi:hypothetical protein [Congregibacter litoralis]|uniref:Uncharacterized protein n=1 Tax=Congregibacter litoralis KT71 TaxID=314285 RepID=A4AC27_9GAMM|nr:hypothetical protein [Congregibacter litoralis]EAQ96477.1 hypothetical protein KT71_05617 [Congregibacter litoralis KT71]